MRERPGDVEIVAAIPRSLVERLHLQSGVPEVIIQANAFPSLAPMTIATLHRGRLLYLPV